MKTKTPDKHVRCQFKGMTLIELMVVISIMVILMAVAVPSLKPMLESQRTRSAAQAVGVVLQRARLKAMEDRSPVGVRFERYLEGAGNNSDACVLMRLCRFNENDAVVLPEGYGVIVTNGDPAYYKYDKTDHWDLANPIDVDDESVVEEWDYLRKYVTEIVKNAAGDPVNKVTEWYPSGSIQIGGRLCNYTDGTHLITDAFGNPVNTDPNHPQQHVIRKVRSIRPSLAAPGNVPRGTVVDLRWSGIGDQCFDPGTDSVTVLFSPGGFIDRVIVGLPTNPPQFPTRPIHFLIGDWDHLDSLHTLREEGKKENNYELASNFWITIDPRTGMISTNEVFPVVPVDGRDPTDDEIGQSRQFANEYYRNYGGF
ncbi:MAG TPA: hypothetical protein DEB39_14400 [Planctomycetaceae bacterium]|nr:hypothetical protein [Planctomycetaceae bacterium]